MDETTTVSNKGNKSRSFNLEFRLDVINYAKSHSNGAAAKRFNVDEVESGHGNKNTRRLR